MTDNNSERRLRVAKIAAAHGVRGLVKLHVYVENTDLLSGALYKNETGNDTLQVALKNRAAKHWLAQIEGANDRDSADALRGTELYLPREALPEPEDNEMYISDLVGLKAVDEDDKPVGEIVMIQNWGAGDLLEIAPDEGGDTFYLPYNDETVPSVEDDKVIVRIPEGLRD